MLKIIVTGPESSGKTTLCKSLSKHFKIPFIEEYARKYLDELGRDYKQDDLLEIAKGQLENEQTTTNKHQLSLYDTDLITMKIWSIYKYKNCPPFILNHIEKQKSKNRIYLLCSPDIPWKNDYQRENPNDRVDLFASYKQELDNLGHDYFIVKGGNRIENSIAKISQLITKV